MRQAVLYNLTTTKFRAYFTRFKMARMSFVENERSHCGRALLLDRSRPLFAVSTQSRNDANRNFLEVKAGP
jgi:hypothetical protein